MPAVNSASRLVYPDWQSEYEAALLELDPCHLPERIHTARMAILNRLQVLSASSENISEKQAIEQALAGLRFLAQLLEQ